MNLKYAKSVFSLAAILLFCGALTPQNCLAEKDVRETPTTAKETEAERKKNDELESKAVSLYVAKLQVAMKTPAALKIETEIQQLTKKMGEARDVGRRAYETGQLGAQMAATNRIMEYSGQIMRTVAKESVLLNKSVWNLLAEEEKPLFVRFVSYVPRDAGRHDLIAKRPQSRVPSDWVQHENPTIGFTVHVPGSASLHEDEKGFHCEVHDTGLRFKVVVHDSDDKNGSFWSRVSSIKDAAEGLAFSEGVAPNYSGHCTVNSSAGREVDFNYRNASGEMRSVSVRAVQQGSSIIVLSCERNFGDHSMRIANAFFDSYTILK